MSRRFLIIALVFAVGFGVGYGATWLVVGSPDKTPAPAAVGTGPQAATGGHDPRPATEPATVPAADASLAAPTSPTAPDAEATAPAAADVAPAEDTAIAAAADSAVAPAGDDAAAPPAAVTWWDACKGKVCVVDWGRVSGGISVREGSIEHGSEVDWEATFAKAEKVGTLEAKKGMKLEVLGVGLAGGKPVAAWVKFKNLKGVIALSFRDKAITFKPPTE